MLSRAGPTRPLQGQDQTAEFRECDSASVMAALGAGDHAALEKLMRAYWRPLTAYASRLLNDLDTAEDMVQDVFVKLWAGRSKWTSESVSGLLFRLTRNTVLDKLRQRKSRARIISIAPYCGVCGPKTPSEQLDDDRLTSAVDNAIQDLPSRRREVFDLAHLRGLSYKEVAAVMGISPKTVGNHMTAALRQLRQVLQPLVAEDRDTGTDAVPSSQPKPVQSSRGQHSFRPTHPIRT